MWRYLPIGVVFAIVLGTGVVHGLWTDRWTDRGAIANRLDQLPLQIGEWQGRVREMDASGLGPIAGCMSRTYVNQRTGVSLSMSLVCGRPGPVAIHTPDVCYAASGFETAQTSNFTQTGENGLPAAEFKTAQFVRTRAAEQTHLRVIWSWYAGGAWTVSETPRFAFAREPVLYKLHVVREMTAASESLESDPCMEFLRLLLPELQRSVISG